MVEDMTIERYLAAGGVLTNPVNVPPRYRAELMKLMATFVDSELAGAAGFANVINQGPGIKERIAAAKIVLEKTDSADRVLKIMGEFGANTDRYATHHPWTMRLDRDADIGSTRTEHDMRLAVFNYPIEGWADAVVMNLLMSQAVDVQLAQLSQVSYQPLAEVFREIVPIESRQRLPLTFELASLATTLGVRHGLVILDAQQYHSGGCLVGGTSVKGGMLFERVLICYGPVGNISASSGLLILLDMAR